MEDIVGLNILFSFSAGLIGYIIYKSKSAFIWGYSSYILPEIPKILRVFEVSNLYKLIVFSHTAGIILWPLILIMINALLASLGFIKKASSFQIFLPKWIQNMVIVEKLIGTLQRYDILPKPLTMKDVYLIGMIGCFMNMLFWITTGFL